MKNIFRFLGIITLIFCFSGLLSAQIQRPSKSFKIELGLNFGSTLGYSITETTYAEGPWNGYDITSVNEEGTISPELSTPLSLGGDLSLITSMGIGVQLAVDTNFSSDITGLSDYYSIHDDDYLWYDKEFTNEWDVTGSAKMMVFSLNFIYKYYGGMFCPWFAAGGSYFSGNLEMNSKIGFGFEDSWQDFEYVAPDVVIDETLSGIGFNVGAGVDIAFSPNIAFTVEGRYFILKKHEFYWEAQGGQYQRNVWGGTFNLPSPWVDYINDELLEPVEFNPSFPKLAAGIKFTF